MNDRFLQRYYITPTILDLPYRLINHIKYKETTTQLRNGIIHELILSKLLNARKPKEFYFKLLELSDNLRQYNFVGRTDFEFNINSLKLYGESKLTRDQLVIANTIAQPLLYYNHYKPLIYFLRNYAYLYANYLIENYEMLMLLFTKIVKFITLESLDLDLKLFLTEVVQHSYFRNKQLKPLALNYLNTLFTETLNTDKIDYIPKLPLMRHYFIEIGNINAIDKLYRYTKRHKILLTQDNIDQLLEELNLITNNPFKLINHRSLNHFKDLILKNKDKAQEIKSNFLKNLLTQYSKIFSTIFNIDTSEITYYLNIANTHIFTDLENIALIETLRTSKLFANVTILKPIILKPQIPKI